MKLATHLHLMLKLRMSDSTPYTFMAYTRTTVPLLVLLLICSDTPCNNNNNNNKDLTIEIQRMWNMKTTVIPVITGVTGTISKSFRKYVGNIPGSHEVWEL